MSNYLIIFLSSVAVGMIIGLLTRKKEIYHGPNARKQSKIIYKNKKSGKCLRFNIKRLMCPKK